MSQPIEVDIAIIGGGMNGASLAMALANSPLRVALVEANPPGNERPCFDERGIALANASVRLLDQLGVWSLMAEQAAPIRQVHVSDRGHFGFAHLDCADEGVDALGYVMLAHHMGAAFDQHLAQQDNLQLYCPAQLTSFKPDAEGVDLTLTQGDQPLHLRTRLLVAADGADSPIRQQLGIKQTRWGYGHHAIISNITPGRPKPGVAFERFTDSGPLALLPLPDKRMALVWTALDHQVEGILALSDEAFRDRLQTRFGYRLGRISNPSPRQAYPLRLMQVREHYRQRCLLIGNAAHALHPVGGQGFNLGLRDGAILAELLLEAGRLGQDPGADNLLSRYVSRRDPDQKGVGLATDVLARLFSSPLPPLRCARNLGLLGLDLLPGGKHLFARHAMGLGTRLPNLRTEFRP